MRKIVVKLMTGYCGEEVHNAFSVSDSYPEDEINEDCYQLAVEHAESYGHYAAEDETGWDYEPDYEWWDYRGKEDDMYRMGGGSFEEDF